MDAKALQQFEENLVNEFFARLNQQAQPEPRQIAAPVAAEPTRPYYRGPSQKQIEREQIEDQLRLLVEASTARLYELLTQRLDQMKAEQQAAIETEQKRSDVERKKYLLEIERAARVSPPCTPSRGSCY